MSDLAAFLSVSHSNSFYFTNASNNDMLLYPETSNQNIYIGTKSNSAAALVVSSNSVSVAGDISFTGSLLQNGVPYSSGVGFSNFGSNLFIMGSNIAIGVSNPVEQFQVRTGNARFDCNLYVFSNIGVGKSNPAYSIDTAGDINFGGILRQNGVAYVGSQWSNNASNIFVLGSNIGIYTQAPSEAIDIRGSNMKVGCNMYVMSNLGVGKSNPAYSIDTAGDINFGGVLRQGGVPYIGSQWSNNTSNLFILGSNVGIGTQTPSEAFHVASSNAKFDCNVYVMSNLAIGKSNPLAPLDVAGSVVIGSNISLSNTTGSIALTSSGTNLGIGTASPLESLTIVGSNIGLSNASGKIVITSSNGNLGINNSNPQTTLDVVGTTSFRGNVQMNNAVAIKGLTIYKRDGTMANITTSSVTGFSNDTTGNVLSVASNNSNYSFRFTGGTTEIARLAGNGMFGIGTSNPSYSIDVNGTVNASLFRGINIGCLITKEYDESANSTISYLTSNTVPPPLFRGRCISKYLASNLASLSSLSNRTSRRIIGYVAANTTDTYTFSNYFDDYGVMYINGTKVCQGNYLGNALSNTSVSVTLSNGKWVPICIEYIQTAGGQSFTLMYKNTTTQTSFTNFEHTINDTGLQFAYDNDEYNPSQLGTTWVNGYMNVAESIGIGLSNPSYSLDVAGSCRVVAGNSSVIVTSNNVLINSLDTISGEIYNNYIADSGSSSLDTLSTGYLSASNIFGGVTFCNQTPLSNFPGGSVYLPGTAGSYLVLARQGSLAAPSNIPSFTIESWINYPATPTNGYIVGQMQPGGSSVYWSLGVNNTNNLFFYGYNGQTGTFVGNTTISSNSWNHIAATYNSSTRAVQLFVNGVLQTLTVTGAAGSGNGTNTGTMSANIFATADLIMGQFNNVATNTYIYDLRITHYATLYTGTFTAPAIPLGTSSMGSTRVLLKAPQYVATTHSNAINVLDSQSVHCLPNDYLFYMDQNGTTLPNLSGSNTPLFDSNVTNSVVFNRAASNHIQFAPTMFNIATKGFTAVASFQFTSNIAAWERIVDFGNGAPSGNILFHRNNSLSTFNFAIYNSSNTTTLSTVTLANINNNVPYVVALRYNPFTSNMTAWVNGTLYANTSNVTNLGNDRLLNSNFLGRSPWVADSYANANVKAIAIYNRSLTDKEIKDACSTLMNTPSIPASSTFDVGSSVSGKPALSVRNDGTIALAGALVANNNAGWFPLDYGNSNLNVHGGVLGSVPFLQQGPFAGEGSMYFNGVNGNTVGFSNNMFSAQWWQNGGFTCEAWVNYQTFTGAATGSAQPLAMGSMTQGGTPSLYWSFGALNSGLVSFFYWNGSLVNVTGTTTMSTNTWYHIAVSYDMTSIRLFLNGNLEGTASVSGTPQQVNSSFGFGYSGACITGYLANPRLVYGAAIYTAAFAPPSTPLGQHTSGTTALAIRVQRDPGRVLVPKIGGTTTAQAYPPAAMNNYMVNIQNTNYGKGVYIASASSEANPTQTNSRAYMAFDKVNGTLGNLWFSPAVYNTSGVYTGTVITTDVNGNSWSGEWIQLQLPVSIVLSSYSLLVQTNTTVNMPGTWTLLGSTDGTRWVVVNQQSYSSWVVATAFSFNVYANQAYNYYRLVTRSTAGNGTVVALGDWVLYGSQESVSITPDGQVGIGVTRPTQGLEVAGNAVFGGNISAGNLGMFRNRIINGDFAIDQRFNGGTNINMTTNRYTADRWTNNFQSGTMVYNRHALTAADPPYFQGLNYAMKITVSVAAGSAAWSPFLQSIEGYNVSDLRWGTPYAQPVTLSFWAMSTVGGTYSVAVGNAAVYAYFVEYTLTANQWRHFTFTIPGPNQGSFPITNGTCFTVSFCLGAAVYKTAPYTWTTANAIGSTNQVDNFITTASASWYVTGVQLEKGTVATPFEFRPYGIELQLCQRYYRKWTTSLAIAQASIVSDTTAFAIVYLNSAMRATPTITSNSAMFSLDWQGISNIGTVTSISLISGKSSEYQLLIQITGSGFSAGVNQSRQLLLYTGTYDISTEL